jgi:phytoene dehydrogenase-like protein
MTDFDAVVVGSGPNGLVAAVTLAQAGWRVHVIEAAEQYGGGLRSADLLGRGTVHDICSAIHPLALGSPAMRSLPLAEHGLRWVHPIVPLAHPLDDGRAAVLYRSVHETATSLGIDGADYTQLLGPLVRRGLVDSLLSPLSVPRAPVAMARFGVPGLQSAAGLARRRFSTDEAQALFGGLAAHSILSLEQPITAGYGLMLGILGHLVGWPMAAGGSQSIADALVSLLVSLGGTIECGRRVTSLVELPAARAVLCDVGPRQFLAMAGDRVPARYRRRLEHFRYGPGVWKVDWALDGPVPWTNAVVGDAATVHVAGTLAEMATAEDDVQHGRVPARPYVLFVQPSRFDRSRAPQGGDTAWAYCHVPNGSTADMTAAIEAQVERFAPGFRDRIVARHVMGPAAMEAHNANYVGGDINGGVGDLRQFVARPTWSLTPWTTPIDGVYLCSASTPPGGGVHGMCGWHAARAVLRRRR